MSWHDTNLLSLQGESAIHDLLLRSYFVLKKIKFQDAAINYLAMGNSKVQ